MINNFMRSPLPNTLAVIVLIALIVSWVTSLLLSLRDAPISMDKGWYAKLLPLFGILGISATLDLLQIKGVAFIFAAIVFVVFGLNIFIPILRMIGKSSTPLINNWYKWAIPISVIGGLAVAGYLTFVESTNTLIMCGPTGGCEQVQNSKYAILFGVLPIGKLGLIGYFVFKIFIYPNILHAEVFKIPGPPKHPIFGNKVHKLTGAQFLQWSLDCTRKYGNLCLCKLKKVSLFISLIK